MTRFIRILERVCPEFHWGVETMHLRQYLSPQIRVRVFLKGVRKVVPALLPALAPFGQRPLADIMGNFPNMLRSDLTRPQRINLAGYERHIKKLVNIGKANRGDLVIFNVDRAFLKTYAAAVHINRMPTLTTNSRYMCVMGVSDVIDNVVDSKRTYFRFVHNAEKLVAQGFPKRVALELSPAMALKAAGNAYPVALIIAVLHPLLKSVHDALGANLHVWPSKLDIQEDTPELRNIIASVSHELARPCRLLIKNKQQKKTAQRQHTIFCQSESDSDHSYTAS